MVSSELGIGKTVSLASLLAVCIFPYHAVRRMWSKDRSKSMSHHFNPSTSPARRPSSVRMQNIVRQGSSAMARIRLSWSGVNEGASSSFPALEPEVRIFPSDLVPLDDFSDSD